MEDQLKKWLSDVFGHIPDFVVGLILAAIAFGVASGVRRVVRRAAANAHMASGLQKVVARTAYALTLIIGLIVALSVGLPSVNLGAAFGALGVGSVVAGIALKSMIENWVAGTLILFTRPFEIGDQIETDTDVGTVRDIQFRATILQTFDHQAVVIPNSELYTRRVTVNTRYPQVRQKIALRFPNSYPVGPLRKNILDVIASLDVVDTDPAPDVMVTHLGDYSIELTARFWVGPPATRGEVTHVTDAVLDALHERFLSLGIQDIRPESTSFTGGDASDPQIPA